MTNVNTIPQHPLKNESGEIVDFHFSPWGKKTENYDFEKPHRHQFYEILFFIKGGGVHDIDFTTHKAYTRSIHFVAPNNVHLVLRNKNTLGCSLQFESHFVPNGLIDQLPFASTQPLFRPPTNEFRLIENILKDVETEYKNKLPDSDQLMRTQIQLLLLTLKRIHLKTSPDTVQQASVPETVQNFLHLIKEDFTKQHSMRYYAEKLHVSDKHLIDLCKTHTGLTPLKHIKNQVVSEAKKLLYHSKLSVKEIAYKLDFDDPANFSRYFKSISGYSPQEYREGIR